MENKINYMNYLGVFIIFLIIVQCEMNPEAKEKNSMVKSEEKEQPYPFTFIESTLGLPDSMISKVHVFEFYKASTIRTTKSGARLYENGAYYSYSSIRGVMENDEYKFVKAELRWRLIAMVKAEATNQIIELLKTDFQKLKTAIPEVYDRSRPLHARVTNLNGKTHKYISLSKPRKDLPETLIKIDDLINRNFIPDAVPFHQDE